VAGAQAGYLRFVVLDAEGHAAPSPRLGVLRGYPLTLEEHAPLRTALMPGESAGSGSRTLRDRLFTIPTHSLVVASDLARIEEWFRATSCMALARPHAREVA
jgi:hypothetical protein